MRSTEPQASLKDADRRVRRARPKNNKQERQDSHLTKTRNFHQRPEPYNCRLKLKETGEYQRLKEEFARKYKTPIIEEHEPTDEASN